MGRPENLEDYAVHIFSIQISPVVYSHGAIECDHSSFEVNSMQQCRQIAVPARESQKIQRKASPMITFGFILIDCAFNKEISSIYFIVNHVQYSGASNPSSVRQNHL